MSKRKPKTWDKRNPPNHGWIEPRKEKQELHCHNCDRYVQFEIDMALNGNRVIICPNCQHEHCRVVKDGIITDQRWDTRNRSNGVWITATTSTMTSMTTTSSSGSIWLSESWGNSSTTVFLTGSTSFGTT